MTVFRVGVKCDCVLMSIDGKRGAYGFYKNEYVRAPDSTTAATTAELNVPEALCRNPAIANTDAETATLEIDEIEAGFGRWKLAASEGFVFFKSEGD